MKRATICFARWGKRLVALLLCGCLLLCAGCGGNEDPTVPSTEATVPTQAPTTEATEPTELTDPTEPTDPVETTEQTQPTEVTELSGPLGVEDIRQKLQDASQTLAVAFFGYTYSEDVSGVFAHLEDYAPRLCQSMPFLLQIPEEDVVGGTHGEVFCIIPADPAASVTVRKTVMDENGDYHYTNTISSRDSGEPIFVLCNDSGYDPDTEVVITAPDGTETVWYPRIDDDYMVAPLWDDAGEQQIWDFSPYAEDLAADYQEMQTWGWILPSEENLVGKTWGCEYERSDGRRVSYLISFGEETAYVRWNDGIDEEDHEYIEAEWELTHTEGFAVLSLDFGEFAGVLRYDVLYDVDYGQLFTAVDASTGRMEPCFEPLFRYLEPRSLEAPDPMDMVGVWERSHWEIEDCREEDTSGACVIVITGASEDDLAMSFTDRDRPDGDYHDKALDVMQGVIYSGCGNDLWLAAVDHVGLWDTTYTVTLLEDGTLLLQNFYYLDGAPTVSHEWYRRVAE